MPLSLKGNNCLLNLWHTAFMLYFNINEVNYANFIVGNCIFILENILGKRPGTQLGFNCIECRLK